jgi:hypothetical protein
VAHVRDDVPLDLSDEWAALGGRVDSAHGPATQPSVPQAADEDACEAKSPATSGTTTSAAPPVLPATVAASSTSTTQEAPVAGDGRDRGVDQREVRAALQRAITASEHAGHRSTAPTPGIVRTQPDARPRALTSKPRAYQFEDVEATRQQVILRAGFSGPSGAGKTLTALRLGTRMVETMGVGRLFVIDTQHGSAARYAYNPRTGEGYRFRHLCLEHDTARTRALASS